MDNEEKGLQFLLSVLEAVVEIVVVGVGGVVAGQKLGYCPDRQVYGSLVPVQLLRQYLGLA